MADFSEAEIQGLEFFFPSSFVYLSDFHREQAWREGFMTRSMNYK